MSFYFYLNTVCELGRLGMQVGPMGWRFSGPGYSGPLGWNGWPMSLFLSGWRTGPSSQIHFFTYNHITKL